MDNQALSSVFLNVSLQFNNIIQKGGINYEYIC